MPSNDHRSFWKLLKTLRKWGSWTEARAFCRKVWKLDPLASMKNSGLRTKYWILNHSKLIEQSGVAVSEQTHLNPYFSQLQSYWKGFALDNFGIFFIATGTSLIKIFKKKIKLYFFGTSCFAILYISFFLLCFFLF